MSRADRLIVFLGCTICLIGAVREVSWQASFKAQPPPIVVSVSGAVPHPGVISLPAEARLIHAIERCGGLTAQADSLVLDLARPLKDGDHLLIASKDQQITESPTAMPELKEPIDYRSPVRQSSGDEMSSLPMVSTVRGHKPPRRKARREVVPVDINSATIEELEALPFIGPVTARRVVEMRQSLPGGTFRSLEELVTIRGIKRKTFERLKPYLKIEGP